MRLLLQIPQYIGFFLTEIFNTILLWLLISRCCRKYGPYKYIMMFYTIFCMAYGIVEILTQPVLHTYGAGMIIFIDGVVLKHEKSVSLILLGSYCASFGMCILLLALQFVYRYVAICRPQKLHYFYGVHLLGLYIIPMLLSLFWFLLVTVFLGPSELKAEYMRNTIRENYGEDISYMVYLSALYHYTDNSGNLEIRWAEFLSAIVIGGIMQSCIYTMFVCGRSTYKKLQSVGKLLSRRTREMNDQLFRTLVLQTIVPVFLLFLPIGLLITFPMFSISFGIYTNAPVLFQGIYPAIDALIAIFMIRDFRNTVFCGRCVFSKNRLTSQPVKLSSNSVNMF